MATERKVGKNSIKPVGQRSISSMFSNPTAGRPNNGRPVSLMEFLNRKSEKRTSSQGCVADAGLTQEVRERLESTRKNDDNIRINNEQHRASIESSHNINNNESSCVDDSSWPFRRGKALFKDHGDGIGQFQSVEEECSISKDRDEIATSKAQVGAQARDKSRNRVPPSLEIFGKQGGSSSAVDAGACYSPDNIHKNVDEHHVPETASQSSSVDFIDLTEDEVDPAGEDVDTETVDHRKRKRRSQAEPGATEICPVCDELFPPHMLRAHVESELDAMEMTEINAVPEAHNVVPAGGHELPHHIGPERSAEPKERGSKSSRSRHTSVLVLGDEPKHRRHNNKKRVVNRSAATFNHYADGGGWWDEGGVGVDAEAVGSASVWEGLGSMSFGGTL